MTILMLGFNTNYPPLLERTIQIDGGLVRFVADNTDEGKQLFDDSNGVDLVIVNGDDLRENGAVQRFEEFRWRHNCAAFITSYSTQENIQPHLAIQIAEENACFFFAMPLKLLDISPALLNPDYGYTKPMDTALWEKQKEELEIAILKNLRGSFDMLEGLRQLEIIDQNRYKEILEKLIRLEKETDRKVVKVKVSSPLKSKADTILLIDDDAIFAQWGEILGELFAAELGAKLEFVTKLSDGIDCIQEGGKYSAVLLDVRFDEENRWGAQICGNKRKRKNCSKKSRS